MAERDLNSVASPRLGDAQMAALGRCAGATLKHYGAGDKLIEVGQRRRSWRCSGAASSPGTWPI